MTVRQIEVTADDGHAVEAVEAKEPAFPLRHGAGMGGLGGHPLRSDSPASGHTRLRHQ